MQSGVPIGGWRMPAEWEKHDATWMSFPHNKELWESEWCSSLALVQKDLVAVANAISRFEPVKLVVDPSAVETARKLAAANVSLVELPIDDSWCRDSGPSFITHPEHGIAGVSWKFNAWGGKSQHSLDEGLGRRILNELGLECYGTPLVNEGGAIHVDGDGTLITTESVLLNKNRNPNFTKKEFEDFFTRFLGISKVVWLPGDPLKRTGDMTDGHVDGVCAFSKPGTLLINGTFDTESEYAKVAKENRRALELAQDARGRKFELIDLFKAVGDNLKDTPVFCDSYLNFYIANGAIIMPAYGVEDDQRAIDILTAAFPDRVVVPVNIRNLAHGGGGIHCITQQQPAFHVAK